MLRSFVPADAPEIFAHALPAMGRYIGWFSVVEVNEPSRRIAEDLGGVVVGRRMQRQRAAAKVPWSSTASPSLNPLKLRPPAPP